MNEAVRANLSDKKKIKDLFLVVVRSIEIAKNKQLVSSLIQFFSNLCYGTGKLRSMLAREDTGELLATLKQILDQIKIEVKYNPEDDEELGSENVDPNLVSEVKKLSFEKQETHNRSLLKNSVYSLIGNLCVDKTLRMAFASDKSGILTQCYKDFETDFNEKKFDYLDMANKQLAIFINVSLEECAQKKLNELGIFTPLEELVKKCKSSDQLEREILNRVFNLYSKMFRMPEAAALVAKQRHVVFKTILYFSKEFSGEL